MSNRRNNKSQTYHLSSVIVVTMLCVAILIPTLAHARFKLSEFEHNVARSIIKVYGSTDKQRFSIGNWERTSFVLQGKTYEDVIQVKCKKNVKFEIFAYANVMGSIAVGDCEYGSPITHQLLENQSNNIKAIAGPLLQETRRVKGEKEFQKALNEMSFVEIWNLGNGDKLYFFRLLGVGHGVLLFPTGVLITNDSQRIIIMQYSDYPLCRNTIHPQKMCEEPKQAIKELANLLREQLLQ